MELGLLAFGFVCQMVPFSPQENSSFVQPLIVTRTKEINWKLSHQKVHVENVLRNIFHVANLPWPPAVCTQLGPHYVTVTKGLVHDTIGTVKTSFLIKRVLKALFVKS